MPFGYFDSSALVKLVVEEEGSEVAARLWNECDAAFSSRLAYPEVRAALAAAHRADVLSAQALRRAVGTWNGLWAAVRPVELSAARTRESGELAQRHGLRGADAVHLASALAVGQDAVLMAVWDVRLRQAALQAGLAVVPA